MRKQGVTSPVLPSSELLTVRETVIMNVKGRLDRSNQSAFVEKAYRALAEQPYLIINLAQTEFLDSSAIGTLVALCKQAREKGGNLWLTNLPVSIGQVFALLRLDQFFEICPTVEEALHSRQHPQPKLVHGYTVEQAHSKVVALS